MADLEDLYNRVINQYYVYKKLSSTNDNAQNNESQYRMFRDMSTDEYTEIMISDDSNLNLFLDYTFHELYSNIIKYINIQLLNAVPFNNASNPLEHIKPIVGDENIFLVFKGGTLMKKYLDKFINNIFVDKMNTNINNVKDKYGVEVKNFNIDENNKSINVPDRTNLQIFKDSILGSKFKISDTDYSLFINADTNERFLIIHKFVIGLLAVGFENMTSNFDNYFRDVINNVYVEPDLPAADELSNDTNVAQYGILKTLKKILDDNKNIRKIVNNELNLIPEFDNELKRKIKTFLDRLNNEQYSNNLFILYESIQIITLLIYMLRLNPNVFQDIPRFQIAVLTFDLNEDFLIRKHYEICLLIDMFVENKFILLQRNNFYTLDKFNRLKENLSRKYHTLRRDDKSFQPKFERSYDSKKIDIVEEKYELKYDKIHDPDRPLNSNNFEFREKPSTFVLSHNDAIKTTSIISTIFKDRDNNNTLKNHYITYNTVIKKIRVNGSITTDFDLMRSKFNIVINNPEIIYKNQVPHEALIPSEFIDVSIPRFEDGGRKEFFEHISSHNFYPVFLQLGDNVNKRIFAYSPTEVLEDLVYVLTDQNSLEPWLDKKYKKRLIRMVVLIIMNLVYKNNLEINVLKRIENYNNCKKFTTLCYALHNYIQNPENDYPSHIFASFLIGYNLENINEPNNIKLENYLDTFNNFAQQWLKHPHDIPKFYIKHEYVYIEKIIQHLISWSTLYNFPDNILVDTLNSFSEIYLQTPLYKLNNVNEAKRNFTQLLTILYDIGFKMLYFITPNEGPEVVNIQVPHRHQHGGNNYDKIYRKYLKYKNKYLNNKH